MKHDLATASEGGGRAQWIVTLWSDLSTDRQNPIVNDHGPSKMFSIKPFVQIEYSS